MYRKRAIITCVLYIHYPIFIVHFFQYSRVVCNQEWVMMVRTW